MVALMGNVMVWNLEEKMADLMADYLKMALPLAPKMVYVRVLQMVLLLAVLMGNMLA